MLLTGSENSMNFKSSVITKLSLYYAVDWYQCEQCNRSRRVCSHLLVNCNMVENRQVRLGSESVETRTQCKDSRREESMVIWTTEGQEIRPGSAWKLENEHIF